MVGSTDDGKKRKKPKSIKVKQHHACGRVLFSFGVFLLHCKAGNKYDVKSRKMSVFDYSRLAIKNNCHSVSGKLYQFGSKNALSVECMLKSG